jgi:hypothetical protein
MGAALVPAWYAGAEQYSATYTVGTTGHRVSLNIYDASGHVVRELLHAETQSAGQHTVVWDGKDRAGVDVPSAETCTWKSLTTPSGLHADYLMELSTVPYGNETGPGWMLSVPPGNDTGLRSLAIDSGGIYLGAGLSEGVTGATKLGLDGSSIWTAAQPDYGWAARYAMSSMNGTLYHL